MANTTKKTYKQNAKEKKLVKQLTAMLNEMNEEGLLFLIKQTDIHLYNMKVIALQEADKKNSKTAKTNKKPTTSEFRIEKNTDGSVYHIITNGKYIMFNDEEMYAIIRISQAVKDIQEAKTNLFNWFFKERKDFINELSLMDIEHPSWVALLKYFRKNFKLRTK